METQRPAADRPIFLDLSDCSSEDELHGRIRDTLGFPAYYGKNWDAFWDCIQESVWLLRTRELKIAGFFSLSRELQTYCAPMFSCLRSLCASDPEISCQVIS